MENSKISWCDHTFNPWVGCEPVSEACDNCYAAALTKRFGQDFSQRRLTKTWDNPLKWQRQAEEKGRRFRVFCGSMCDVFDLEADEDWRNSLWHLIDETPLIDWLLLTKRPESIPQRKWPDNVRLGITGETQGRLLERTESLRKCDRPPYPVLFLSAEPLLGPLGPLDVDYFDWVILGCEKINGRPGRQMQDEWAREICENREGPTFVKQMVIQGRVESDPARFPVWARRREFPEAANKQTEEV